MAAIFCLFSVTLCKLSSHEITNEHQVNYDSVQPLSAQLVTVPRVYISPCPAYFRYTFNSKEWFGLLVIPRPAPRGFRSKLQVILSLGFQLHSVRCRPDHDNKRCDKF